MLWHSRYESANESAYVDALIMSQRVGPKNLFGKFGRNVPF